MKKSLLSFTVAIMALFFTSDAFSQARIGVKGALNIANIKADDETGDHLFAPQAGLVVYSNLENALFLQSGLLYTVKGAQEEEAGEKIQLMYSFLELPVNVGFQIPVGESIKVGPYVGGFVGYALTGKLKGGGITIDLFDNDLIGGDPKRLDYGANAGLGVHVNNRFIISAQYSHGLANLSDDGAVKTTTQTISAGLTFLF